MQVEINLNNDNSEKVSYNRANFPVYVQKGILSTYANYAAISHWHDDIEFIYIMSGSMHYNINGKHIVLKPGNGLFVNTRQLHHGFSPEHQECIFICILFHPVLLSSSAYVEQNFILPVLQNDHLSYLILHNDISLEKDILESLKCIFEAQYSDIFVLKAQSLFFEIWKNLFLLSGYTEKMPVSRNRHLTILKDMILFIERNYFENISLEDICSVGKVSKTSGTNIFKKYTNHTPFSYLTEYRLKKSVELLITTDLSISEICFEVGFSGASYFSETFRKIYNCSPREYRLQNSK